MPKTGLLCYYQNIELMIASMKYMLDEDSHQTELATCKNRHSMNKNDVKCR